MWRNALEFMRRRDKISDVDFTEDTTGVPLLNFKRGDSTDATSDVTDSESTAASPSSFWARGRPHLRGRFLNEHVAKFQRSMAHLWSFKKGPGDTQLGYMRVAMVCGVFILLVLVGLLSAYLTLPSFMISTALSALERDFDTYWSNSHASDAAVANYPRLCIGIGEMKTGSTFFGNALHISSKLEALNPKRNSESTKTKTGLTANLRIGDYAFVPPSKHANSETKFWSDCIFHESAALQWVFDTFATSVKSGGGFRRQRGSGSSLRSGRGRHGRCDWDDYLRAQWTGLGWSISDFANYGKVNESKRSGQIVLSEKTPNYMSQPHSSLLLGSYAQIMDVRLYVILRNPVNRLWSHYFFACRNSPRVCNKRHVLPKMDSEIQAFVDKRDYTGDMMTLIDDKSLANAQIDDQLMATYTKSFYRAFVSQMVFGGDDPIVFKSCYYPHLRLFYKHLTANFHANGGFFEDSQRQASDRLIARKFKIIQQETINANPSEVLWRFKCWALRRDDAVDAAADECSAEELATKGLYTDLSQMSFGAGIHPHPELTDSAKYAPAFEMCNQRLYQFIRAHPSLLLKIEGAAFQQWH